MKRMGILILIALSVAIAWFVLQHRDAPAYAPKPEPAKAKSRQEILFEECVAARDHEIHRKTFATVDNPDVQREMLATQKEIAIKECRKQFPGP
jgi:hypothetical protein